MTDFPSNYVANDTHAAFLMGILGPANKLINAIQKAVAAQSLQVLAIWCKQTWVTLLASCGRQEVLSWKEVTHVHEHAHSRAEDPSTGRLVCGGRAVGERHARLQALRHLAEALLQVAPRFRRGPWRSAGPPGPPPPGEPAPAP